MTTSGNNLKNPKTELKVVSIFLIVGWCAGVGIGYLTSLPLLNGFWFGQSTQSGLFTPWSLVPDPTWKYRAILSIVFLLMLIVSYVITCKNGLIVSSFSSFHTFLAIIIIIGAAFFLEAAGDVKYLSLTDLRFIVGPILFVIILSVILWLLTHKWYSHILLLMISALVLRLALTFVAVFAFGLSSIGYNITYYSSGYSLLSALSGYWFFKASDAGKSSDLSFAPELIR